MFRPWRNLYQRFPQAAAQFVSRPICRHSEAEALSQYLLYGVLLLLTVIAFKAPTTFRDIPRTQGLCLQDLVRRAGINPECHQLFFLIDS
jgi:hypothetical protein